MIIVQQFYTESSRKSNYPSLHIRSGPERTMPVETKHRHGERHRDVPQLRQNRPRRKRSRVQSSQTSHQFGTPTAPAPIVLQGPFQGRWQGEGEGAQTGRLGSTASTISATTFRFTPSAPRHRLRLPSPPTSPGFWSQVVFHNKNA